MNEKLFLFGLGTGRCGTVSLAKLLNAQFGAFVTHEERPWLPWILDKELVRLKVVSLEERNADIVGDVALFNLQSVEELLGHLPEAKFVVLRRNKKDTIDSFRRKWRPKYNRIMYKKIEWDNMFPNYKLGLKEAVNKYYNAYYDKVAELEELYPQNVKCFNIQVLNDIDGVNSILDFCRVSEDNRVVQIGVKANKGNRV